MDNMSSPATNAARVAAPTRAAAGHRCPRPQSGFLLFNQRDPGGSQRGPIRSWPTSRSGARSALALDRQAPGARRARERTGRCPTGRHPRSSGSGTARPRPPRRTARAASGCSQRAGGWTTTATASSTGTGSRSRSDCCVAQHQRHPAHRCRCWSSSSSGRWASALELGAGAISRSGCERRTGGEFDIDFSPRSQDPSPSGLARAGRAAAAPTSPGTAIRRWTRCWSRPSCARDDARSTWHAVLRRIEDDAPAVFLYAPTYMYVVNRRFRNVRIRPESSWLRLWRVDGGRGARRGRRGILSGRTGCCAARCRPPLTFVVAVTLLFFLMRLAPGRPALAGAGRRAAHARRPARSSSACTGSTGRCPSSSPPSSGAWRAATSASSIEYGRPVTALIAERLPATLLLGGTVLLLNFTLGSGSACARRCGEGRRRTAGSPPLSLAGYATPSFWLGPGAGVAVRDPLATSPAGGMRGSAPRPERRAADARRGHARAPGPSGASRCRS